jgi:hypothetical protein
MGFLHALELANLENDGIVNRETGIRIHLTSNHYPPIPESMVSVCIEAIDAYNKGRHDAMIELPEGVNFRGENTCDIWAVIGNCHLDPWLVQDEE